MATTQVLPGRRPGTAIAFGVIGALLLIVTGCRDGESVDTLVKEAVALRDKGDFPAAVIKLESALAAEPGNVAARLLSARVYIDLAQGDAALGALKRAEHDGAPELELVTLRVEAELIAHRYEDVLDNTSALPSGAAGAVKASLLASRGSALEALGQGAMARTVREEGLALDPHSVDLHILSSRLALDGGDLDAAREELAKALQEAPQDRRLNQLRGDIVYAARDYPESERIYQKILDAAPWNQLARGDLAASQLAEDKVDEAIANLDAVLNDPDLSDAPKDLTLSHIRAVAAYRQKDYSLAQSYSENVISRAPNFEPARLIAGASSYALKEYERANYYLGPYVFMKPGDLLARKLLASVQLQLGHPGDAADTLKQVRDKATGDPELLTLIGVAAARSGDKTAADRFLRLAVEQQPDNVLLRTELGQTEIALGDPKAGIEDLEQAVKDHPEAVGPLMPLFLGYMQAKEYDKALALAAQVTASEPKDSIGYLLSSSVYLVQGNVGAGREALLRAHELRPGDINANRNLAKLALAEGKVDEARQFYQDILHDHPQNTQTYVAVAKLDVHSGRPLDAEAVLLKGVQANPDDFVAAAMLARFQLVQGKMKDALAGGQQTLKKFPRDPALLDIIGHAQLGLDQADAALSTFHDLVQIVPQAARAHTDLAEAYLARYTPGNPQWPAINEATEAVKLDPKDGVAKIVLTRALILHGRLAEAHDVSPEFKPGDPQDIAVTELDGLAAQGEGRLADAAAAFARAVALQDNAVDRKRLADAQLRLGRTDDAAKTLTAWLGAHSDDVETREVLAELYLGAGRLTEASEQYAELVRQQPKDPALQNNLAWVMSRLGRLEEALAHAREAVALAPDSADILDTLGAVMLQNGSPADAVEALDKAWQKSSHRPEIGFHLSQALAAAGKKQEALDLLHGLLTSGGVFADRAQADQLLQQLGG